MHFKENILKEPNSMSHDIKLKIPTSFASTTSKTPWQADSDLDTS